MTQEARPRGRWIRVSADLDDDPRILNLPSDGARYAWVVTLGRGKYQPVPGVWQSAEHFAASLRKRSKWLDRFLESGLLVKMADGQIKVRGWEWWQTDPTAKERQDQHRARP